MQETAGGSIYGDAEARRRRTLDAAGALLDEGGYAALTIRSVAKRAGTSTGLIYQYFGDKQDIFMALLNEGILASLAHVEGLPQRGGVAEVLTEIIDETVRRWTRVGQMSIVWRDAESVIDTQRESLREVYRNAALYDAGVLAAVTAAAEREGRTLRTDPGILPFLMAGIQGVAATIVTQWVSQLATVDFPAFAADGLTRAITADAESAPGA